MIMPIVSMNKMAMNESVAATCCFRQVATPTAVYWEVLHGGWVGAGYVTKLAWRDGWDFMDKTTWMSKDFGKDLKGDKADIADLVKNYGIAYGSHSLTGDAFWYLTDGYGPVFANKISLETAIGQVAPKVSLGKSCDHENGDCTYRTFVTSYETNQHFESTSAHADLKKWAEPHVAKQFAS